MDKGEKQKIDNDSLDFHDEFNEDSMYLDNIDYNVKNDTIFIYK